MGEMTAYDKTENPKTDSQKT